MMDKMSASAREGPGDEGWAPLRRERRVILVVDMADSVQHYDRDEEGTAKRWFALVDHVEHRLPALHGRVVKSLGDGMMMEFDAVPSAVLFAGDIQTHVRGLNEGLPADQCLWLRCGIHAGEVIPEARDVQGRVANMTARLASLGRPGETIVSADVRDQLVPGLDADVEDLGECFIKGLREPVRAYRLWAEGRDERAAASAELEWRSPKMRPTVAVVPFVGRGADPRVELVGEAVADEIINLLSRAPELSVISRLSTTSLRDRAGLPELVRDRLAADYLATGSLQIVKERVQLHVEVIELVGQRVLWADTLARAVEQSVGAHAEIAQQVSAEICRAVLTNELGLAQTKPLPNLDAYTMLLGGVLLLHRGAPREFERARTILEGLTQRVPHHPLPWAWLARWHDLYAYQGLSDDPPRQAEIARSLAQRALDLDPQSSLALTTAGAIQVAQYADLDGGIALYTRAIDSNPNESLAWIMLGAARAFRGDGPEAVAASRQALRLSPLDPFRFFYDSLYASCALSAGDTAGAIDAAQRSLRANRMHLSTYRVLAIAQTLAGNVEAARDTVKQMLVLDPQFSVKRWLARSPGRAHPKAPTYARALVESGAPP